ncbi:MAG: hypothetical protein ACOYN0_13680, partial [Phycisphaerales bacterium]
MLNNPQTRSLSGAEPAPGIAAQILGWAAYLACSWTWCIGMFLPVLLIRDLGWSGFVAFALPNIVGAAIFGVTLARRGSSEQFVASHRTLVWLFSVVTVCFQAFFLGSLLRPLPLGPEQGAILLGATGFALLVHFTTDRTAVIRLVSIGTWIVSAALMVFAARGGHAGPPPALALAPPDKSSLAGLGMVCALGFSFCPYLDRTFHEARRKLPGVPGTIAFIFGFCVLFAAMISFTVLYAREGTLTAVPLGGATEIPLSVALDSLVLAHIAVQLGFTIGAHAKWAVAEAPAGGADSPAARARLWVLGPVLVGLLASMFVAGVRGVHGLGGFETAYRAFLAFYGLVFPAYVWLCATPLGASPPPTRRSLVVWVCAMIAASPFYWLGFMQREYAWLLLGVGIIASAKLLLIGHR